VAPANASSSGRFSGCVIPLLRLGGQIVRTWLSQAVWVFESKARKWAEELNNENASFPKGGGWLHIFRLVS
jgi:hypothetical protein